MKRTLLALAAITMLAGPVWAQGTTNPDSLSQQTGTPTTSGTDDRSEYTTSTNDSGTLPATASPLPLILASGLAALGAGAWLSRRRRS